MWLSLWKRLYGLTSLFVFCTDRVDNEMVVLRWSNVLKAKKDSWKKIVCWWESNHWHPNWKHNNNNVYHRNKKRSVTLFRPQKQKKERYPIPTTETKKRSVTLFGPQKQKKECYPIRTREVFLVQSSPSFAEQYMGRWPKAMTQGRLSRSVLAFLRSATSQSNCFCTRLPLSVKNTSEE